jgi:hypothetical protein
MISAMRMIPPRCRNSLAARSEALMELRRVKIQKTSINQFLEGFCTTQVNKIQTKNFARKTIKEPLFGAKISSLSFKSDHVFRGPES